MAKFDIFALPLELRDDTFPDTFVDLDGNRVLYTPERIARQINNILSGHHAGCELDDCPMVEAPESQMARMMGQKMDPIMIGQCYLTGPMNRRIAKENKRLDAEVEAKMKKEMPEVAQHIEEMRRKVGFDPERLHRDDTARGDA